MGESVKLLLVFFGAGVALAGVGVPLLLGRVPPNSWYGCRTSRTLSDERVWYAVNRVTGLDLILAGVFVVISSLAVFAFGQSLGPDAAAAVMVSVILLSVFGMALHSSTVSRRLTSAGERVDESTSE